MSHLQTYKRKGHVIFYVWYTIFFLLFITFAQDMVQFMFYFLMIMSRQRAKVLFYSKKEKNPLRCILSLSARKVLGRKRNMTRFLNTNKSYSPNMTNKSFSNTLVSERAFCITNGSFLNYFIRSLATFDQVYNLLRKKV